MEYFLHIKSQLPSIITVDDKCMYLEKIEDTFSLKTDEVVFVTYQPTVTEFMGAKTLPYTVKLNLKEISKNKLVQTTVYPKNHTEILLRPNNIDLSPLPPTKLNVVGKNYLIKTCGGDNSSIEISHNDLLYVKKFNAPLMDYKTRVISPYIVFEGYSGEDTNLLILKASDCIEEEFSFTANEVEKKDDAVVAVKYAGDIAKQGVTYTIKISKAGLDITHKTVYTEGKPQILTHSKIVPFAFCEALKYNNHKLARQYLSDALNDRLTKAHLEKFFEGLIAIRQNLYIEEEREAMALIFKGDGHYIAKLYKFDITAGKIDDIVEL